jgi:hypothetical protein
MTAVPLGSRHLLFLFVPLGVDLLSGWRGFLVERRRRAG